MYHYGLFFAGCYLALKLLVRWVWYRPEHLRPGYIRHYFTIRALDFAAIIFLCATFFMLVNTMTMMRTFVFVGGLVLYDLLLRAFFLNLEAWRICKGSKSKHWTMDRAKRRLRRRARQETPF